MVISNKYGNIYATPGNRKAVEYVLLEWYEANKRILHKKTNTGRVISLKFLQGNPDFRPGDILFEDEQSVIVVEIAETEVIVIHPKNMQEMASVCYEIGNKHLPLFYQDEALLVAFEHPLYQFLFAAGYEVTRAKEKLLSPLKTTVTPHNNNSTSLFNRIMNLTTEKG